MTESPQRQWYNAWVERYAFGDVLDVGKSKYFDYGFDTIDINPKLKPTITGDICHSELPSDNYDVVLCNGMYEFVDDPQLMVKEVGRILKVGGTALFGFVNKNYVPYKKNWRYYDGDIDFGMEIVDTKSFPDYEFITCVRDK